jgi:GNAT superfamily N-acetyltransferase
MTYEVVPYAPAMRPEILQLQTHLWSGDIERNAAYFEWKYLDNPYLHEVLICVGLCQGRVVAMRGLFGAMWEADDGTSPRLLPCADDFVVAPEHRNRGAARQLLETSLDVAAHRGLPFALSLSASPVTFVASLAAGWRSAGSYQPLRREGRAPSGWSRGLDRLRRHGSPGVFDRLERIGGPAGTPITLARAPRPEAMAGLIRRLPWNGRIRHLRDARYLEWRFRNPLHAYRFLFWEEDGLQGYLVLQRYLSELADPQVVNISDWEAANDEVRSALLAAAVEWGEFACLRTWTAGASESVCALLRRHEFRADSDGAGLRAGGLLVRRLDPVTTSGPCLLGRRNLLDLGDWDMRMLYSMAG